MELLDKKLTGLGPEISVHPGVTLFLSLFLTKNGEAAHALQKNYSTMTNRFSSIM